MIDSLRVPVVLLFLVPVFAADALAQEAPNPHAHHAQAAADEAAVPSGESREASGTAWLPDETAPSGAMWHRGGWMLMTHANVFIYFTGTSGTRSARQFGSTNWMMAMARHPLAGGQVTVRLMSSLEPLTATRCGYPDLLQTGESCRGERLHDRQHPHDVFMEVAAHYRRPVARGISLELYGGPAGEPALGPVAFPHRPSALTQPMAPVSHHWLDATHVSFGVATAGLSAATWKVEMSAFNGREPDDARYGFDLARLDSVAARVWWLPTRRVAMQVSTGVLHDVHDGEDVRRTTASLVFHRLDRERSWTSTLAWGMNDGHDGGSHAILAESSLALTRADTAAVRFEVVPRTNLDLGTAGDAHDTFTIAKLQGVYTRSFARRGGVVPALGIALGAARLPDPLVAAYGRRVPMEFSVFLNVRQ